MSDDQLPRIRKRRLVSYRNRGAVYSWLRAHHTRVTELLSTGEGTWPKLCAEMARHGVSDRVGETPTPNQAFKVWRRLQAEVGSAGLPEAPRPGSTYPSRITREWRPTVVHRVVALPTSVVVPVSPSEASFRVSLGLPPKTEKVIRKPLPDGQCLSDEEVDAEMESILAKLNSRKVK